MFGGFRSPGTWRGSVCGIDVVGAKNGEHGLKGEKSAKNDNREERDWGESEELKHEMLQDKFKG